MKSTSYVLSILLVLILQPASKIESVTITINNFLIILKIWFWLGLTAQCVICSSSFSTDGTSQFLELAHWVSITVVLRKLYFVFSYLFFSHLPYFQIRQLYAIYAVFLYVWIANFRERHCGSRLQQRRLRVSIACQRNCWARLYVQYLYPLT